MDLIELREALRAFAAERDWDQFHEPKNLLLALVGEVGELAEIFQWLTLDQASRIGDLPDVKAKVSEELADTLMYLVRLADKVNIDLSDAVTKKLEKNAEKYPADLVYGSAKKYDEY